MLKPLLVFFVGLLISCATFAQKADTTIIYFKMTNGGQVRVESLSEADYYRLVIPPDQGDKRYNIKEYYKTGQIKFIAKTYVSKNSFSLNPTSDFLAYDDQCVSYFPSGKKQAITTYKNGRKDGLEYLFYPTGEIYCVLKHYQAPNFETLNWECYDKQGTEICQNGNGKWIVYDNNDYIIAAFEGPVKSGYMDGEWHGFGLVFKDTVRLVYQYRRNRIISSTGYDKQGNAHPFKSEVERAEYKSGNIDFVTDLRHNIKLPRDTDGRKMSMDTAHVFFTVEKDGHLSGFRINGEVDPKLKEAIFTGLSKISGWTPHKLFGIPFRAELVFPLNDVDGIIGGHWQSYAEWGERVLKDD